MEKKTYKAKVELIRQGQDGKQMYVLEKGQVAVSKVMTIEFSSLPTERNEQFHIFFIIRASEKKKDSMCVIWVPERYSES